MDDITALFYRDAEQVWGQGKLETIDEHYADDVVFHTPGDRAGVIGRTAYRRAVAAWRTAFPDMQVIVIGEVADAGSLAVGRWLLAGTHTGIWHDALPTGRRVEIEELVVVRCVDGVIEEIWQMFDLQMTLARLSMAAAAV
jgi:predicted ester cyclase